MSPQKDPSQNKSLPPVGAKIKLTRDGNRWWDVRCADERFAICTRQAEFQPKGELRCTILDIQEGIRGACNQIGNGWDLHMSDEACAELLKELQIGAKVQTWNAGDHSFDLDAVYAQSTYGGWVQISHRNQVPLDLGMVVLPEVGAR